MSLPINMYGWCGKTTAALTADDNVLTFSDAETAELCATLGDTKVGMTLRSNSRSEFITIACTNGVIVAERGVDGSEPLSHVAGAVMRFDWTPTNMGLAFACYNETPAICQVVSNSLDVSLEKDDDDVECIVRIELAGTATGDEDDSTEVSWRACGKKYTASTRLVTVASDPDASKPGVYDPARVVVDDSGCVKYSEAVVATHVSCCGGCNTCSEDESTE